LAGERGRRTAEAEKGELEEGDNRELGFSWRDIFLLFYLFIYFTYVTRTPLGMPGSLCSVLVLQLKIMARLLAAMNRVPSGSSSMIG
jgi:hypothetical protein